TVLFLILPVAYAYGYFAALHLFLAGAFTYAYLRVIGVSRAGGVVGALAFMFSGRMVTSVLWPQMVGAMVYLPLLLVMVELIFRQAHGRWPVVPAMAGSLILGLSILAGHIEASVYVMATLSLYALARLLVEIANPSMHGPKRLPGRYVIKTAGPVGALLLLGAGLAAVQLLPFYEVGQLNFRSGTVSYGQVIGFALKLPQLLTFVMPDFYGNPTIPSASGWGPKDYVEQAAYVGVLPLLLGLASLWFALRGPRDERNPHPLPLPLPGGEGTSPQGEGTRHPALGTRHSPCGAWSSSPCCSPSDRLSTG
ncbi:MAG: hypothetical protein KGJ86_11635, partial [Chloroflexota bacterium]|nr:hypothetical protein [Chloroflexota bacterium]